MVDGRLTRATVQALSSLDNKVVPPVPSPPSHTTTNTQSIIDRAGIGPVMPDSNIAGAPASTAGQLTEIVVKKKRGRPPKNPSSANTPASNGNGKRIKKEKEDEDVCFICFDGGNLVLCDHRDCPKAYHPACVKRDESFFRPSIRWNCGWHLCNICQKNALFMCYTCPYSLCKGCVKQADILCVRGNKGFCRNCMTTIMLIENIPQENKESVQVDFDDSTSWEYLFKVYWVLLKQKESFTLDELTRASNPWKGSGLERKDYIPHKVQDTCHNKVSGLSSSYVHLEANAPKRRKTRKQPQLLYTEPQKVNQPDGEKGSCVPGQADWASKELLEFVSHMKNGDTSVMSQFDVQALLLEYIRTNNLRDPRRKCQIICDRRLESLFGKSRVGHFEMLKLLEYHFTEESRTNGMIRGAAIDPLACKVDTEGINGDIHMSNREMRRQNRRKGDEKGQQNHLDSYAAIDVHNINLIYLKRNLLENLIKDAGNLHDKVVGSIVRIKISSNDQKQDMHRLVRIIGTSKTTKLCKIGDKTEDMMLKILNLNKIEDVAIDAISDQEFSEDECRRLRQSIKLGLVERMTVGEIQEKAMALQTVRVNNWLEAEMMKLNHLRDRASEMGHRKELRECVEKIELLKTPEERQRRIHEIPEVHADHRMDPSYGSDDDSGESDTKKQNGSMTSRYSNSISTSLESIPPCRVGDVSKDNRGKLPKISVVNGERKRKNSGRTHAGKVEGAARPLGSSQHSERVDAASRASDELNSRANSKVASDTHVAAPDPSTTSSTGLVHVSDRIELEKIWHYQDPLGKVQGPFCLLQLRKWNSNGFFPTDLRVWRANEMQDQSILLNDALTKQLSGECLSQQHTSLPSNDGAKSEDRKASFAEELSSNTDAPWIDHKPNEEGSNSNLTASAAASDGNEQSTSDQSGQQLSNDQGALDQSSAQNIISQIVESLFTTGEASSGAGTGSSSSESFHMTPKTESPDQTSLTPESVYVDSEIQAVKNEPSSTNASAPDLTTSYSIKPNGNEASDLPGSVPKSEGNDLKNTNVENQHSVASDTCNDFAATSPKLPSSIQETGVKVVLDSNRDDKQLPTSAKHDSGTSNTVSGGADISVLPNTSPKADSEGVKPDAAENTDTGLRKVAGKDSVTSWGSPSGATDISGLPSTTTNKEDLKTRTTENENYVSPNVPQQESGASWSTMTCDILFSDMPGVAPKQESDSLKTSAAENINPGQDSRTSWSTISGAIGFADLHTNSLNLNDETMGGPALENKYSVAPNIPGQDSCISWSTASSLVGGEVHLPDSCQLTHCSTGHLDCDTSGWQPIELATLGDESVSDLLSEVEAMESLRGMSSPFSRMNDDSIDSPQHDCFSPLGGLSPNIDPGKNDALSSTTDIQFHIQSTGVHDIPRTTSFVHDIPRTSFVVSNPSPEVEAQVKPASISMPHHSVVSEAPMPPPLPTVLPPPPPPPPPPRPPAPSPPPPPPPHPPAPSPPPPKSSSPPPPKPPSPPRPKPPSPPRPKPPLLQKPPTVNLNRPSSPIEEGEVDPASVSVNHREATPKSQPSPRTASTKMAVATSSGRDPQGQENAKFSGTGSILGNPNMHWSTTNHWNQTSPRYSHSLGRHSGPKDRSHHHHNHVVDSGFGKSRPSSWSRQSSFNGGGGGSSRLPAHRGQRVCKFYESGYCKKGASCKYLHP